MSLPTSIQYSNLFKFWSRVLEQQKRKTKQSKWTVILAHLVVENYNSRLSYICKIYEVSVLKINNYEF